MSKIIAFFVKYKVWTNVVLFSIFGFGAIFVSMMNYSFFPEIPPDQINIQVVYPGASPEEVERGVILKIEENLEGLEGVERVTSTSKENIGTVNVEVEKDYELDDVLTDVKNAVDRINSFPQGIEKPVIFEQEFRSRAVSVVVYGSTDLYDLKYIAENMRDKILISDKVSQVNVEGVPELQFSIEVSEENLRRYGLTFEEIRRAVASSNINISGGKFETEAEEILIRANGRGYYAEELNNIPVRGKAKGDIVYLKDVADVTEQWEDVPDRTYYNGKPAAILTVNKTKAEDIIAVAETVKKEVENFNAASANVQALVIDDRTVPLTQRLELLVKNGLIGLLLVIITLWFFLNLRLSFWVTIGIPFSFAGMFIVASLSGITINVISLFGMIIVVGILVDDAIVVGENIYAHYERGKPAIKAAIDGAKEMVAPVFTSIFTTVLAFMPFFFLDGFLGKFIWHMALVVIAALLFSLVEAFLILPPHLAHSKGLHPHQEDSKIRKKIEGFINKLTHKFYGPSLKTALKHKWITLVLPIGFVFITVGLLRGGLIGVTFFPYIDSDNFPVNMSLVPGRQEATTDSLLTVIEKAAWKVNEDLQDGRPDGKDVITGIRKDIGSNDFGETGSHTGKLTVELMDGEERQLESFNIANMVQKEAGKIPEAQNLTYGSVSFFGKPVSVSLLGIDLNELQKATNMLEEELKGYPELKDVTVSNQEGRRELNIQLKPRAHALGLSLTDVAGQVRAGFFGSEVQRLQRGRDEIKVWVRYNEEDRSALGKLDNMRIKTPNGSSYPFSKLAEYDIERGVTEINHLKNRREIKVEANVRDVREEIPPILQRIQNETLPSVLSKVRGVQASFEGQSRQQRKVVDSMKVAFPMALVAMFILVILVFRSYAQAGLIFSLIPISVMGAIWGHGIQGLQVNMLSIYGIIALSGIIVNDSIVFVSKINWNLKAGNSLYDSVYNAGLSRLRPILLTTLTTAAGLGPIIFETSRQAQFLIPMAVSVAWGMIFGTLILLYILPAGFLALNKLRSVFSDLITKGDKSREDLEPAVKELTSARID